MGLALTAPSTAIAHSTALLEFNAAKTAHPSQVLRRFRIVDAKLAITAPMTIVISVRSTVTARSRRLFIKVAVQIVLRFRPGPAIMQAAFVMSDFRDRLALRAREAPINRLSAILRA
jgi:hypothetical protein